MWLGLLYLTHDEVTGGCEQTAVTLFAWTTGCDAITFAGPLDAAPEMARLLREAGAHAPILPPRCDSCGAVFELPFD